MKRSLDVFALVLLCLLAFSKTLTAQDLSGPWQGVNYAPGSVTSDYWPVLLTLEQTNNSLTGECLEVAAGKPQYFVLWQVTNGTVQNNTGSLDLKVVLRDNKEPGSYWCTGTLRFTYYPDEEKIVGQETYTNCGFKGNFELYRLALKSPNTYCKGQLTNLVVTGKNVRWYADPDKKQLLHKGNTYSPGLTQTTTFYVTQTHYDTESPVVPIKVNIAEAAITQTLVSTATCGKDNGVVSVTATGVAPVQYSLNNGPFQSTPLFQNLAPNTYTINIKDANGCQAARQVTISQQNTPKLAISTQNGQCTGTDGRITINVSAGVAPYQYSLDSVAYQTANSFTVRPKAYTAYVKDATGCVVSQSVTVGATNDITLQVLADTAVCRGQSIKLVTTSNASSFSWSPTANLNDASLKEPLATPAGAIDYVVTATAGTCSKKDTVRIRMGPASTPPITQQVTLCAGQPLPLLSAQGTNLRWYGDSTLQVPLGSGEVLKLNRSTSQPGQWSYYLTQTQANKCASAPKKVNLVINPGPVSTLASKHYEGCFSDVPADMLTLQADSSASTTYRWLLPTGSVVSTTAKLVVQQPGQYILELTDVRQCSRQDTVVVDESCSPLVFAPEAFSPDGNGINDVFKFSGRLPQTVLLTIYNRWGEVLLRTSKAEWDGSYQGQSCNEGLYGWRIELYDQRTQTQQVRTGQVVLLRGR